MRNANDAVRSGRGARSVKKPLDALDCRQMSSSSHSAKQGEPARKDGREGRCSSRAPISAPFRRWLADHGTIDGLVLEPRSTQQIFDTTWTRMTGESIVQAARCASARSPGSRKRRLKSLHSAGEEVADRGS